MKTKTLRKFQLFWAVFIGLGAYWGSAMMFIDPSGETWGLDPVLPLLQRLPWSDFFFKDFIWSGVVLTLVNGVPNTISYALIKTNHRYGNISGLICGLILIMWIVFEFFIFGFNPLSDIYLIFGVLQILSSYALLKRSKE